MSAISIPCPECGQALKIRDRSLLGRKAKCPKCSHAFVLQEPAEVELELATSPVAAQGWPQAPVTTKGAPAAAPPPAVMPAASPVATFEPTSGVGRLREMRRRNQRGVWLTRFIMLIGLGIAGGGGYWLFTQQQKLPKTAAPVAAAAGQRSDASGKKLTKEDLESGVAASPTKREPISLAMIPAGARTILHLRPADLWASGSAGEEFRACLGPVGVFLEQQIQAQCRVAPAEIEELTFAWIPGQRGTAPDLAVVVRLKQDRKKSELLDIMGGIVDDKFGRPVYVNEVTERAGVIADLKTFAFGPASMASELASSVTGQNPMPPGIESLLPQTDRNRHISLMFEPTAVLLDAEFMAPSAAQPFLRQFMDWFGDDVETVCWSLHLEADRFYSDLQLRNNTSIRPVVLEEKLRQRLIELPRELLAAVEKMQPATQGNRQIIGRVPAMSKVFAMATLSEYGPRHVQLITPLPDRAAPNLALGTLLAWDESTRTDFTRVIAPPTTATPATQMASMSDRLNLKIDVDFRRTPLQEAFAFISDETKTTIDIDGDALKLSGYTQNMPQTMNLGQVTVKETFKNILKQYGQMCIVSDEGTKTFTVMTLPVAEQKGLKPLVFE